MLEQPLDTIAYHVQPGDSLNHIINRYYGAISAQKRQTIIQQIQHDNPEVSNPDHIVPNQLLFIDIPPQYCANSSEEWATPKLNLSKQQLKPLQQHWNNASSNERSVLSQVAPVMLGTGTASLFAIKTSFQSNAPHLQTLVNLYEDYKANKLTKGQYDYRRRKAIQAFENRLGPLRNILGRQKSHRQILRISRKRGRPLTGNITQHIAHMNRISKLASSGGAILTVASVGLACREIANTDNTLEKNHILMESLGSVFGGTLYGIGATIVLMGTPVGWVAALVIGVGAVASSYAGGQAFKGAYDHFFKSKDIAEITGVSTLCR